MGLKHTMMFTDDIFLESVNKSKWRIFSEAVGDLTLFTCSYLFNTNKFNKEIIQNIYYDILNSERANNLPENILEKYKINLRRKLNLSMYQIILKSNLLKTVVKHYITGLLLLMN